MNAIALCKNESWPMELYLYNWDESDYSYSAYTILSSNTGYNHDNKLIEEKFNGSGSVRPVDDWEIILVK